MHSFEEESEIEFVGGRKRSSFGVGSEAEREKRREPDSGVGVSQMTTMLEMHRTFAEDARRQRRGDGDSEGSLSPGSMKVSPWLVPSPDVNNTRGHVTDQELGFGGAERPTHLQRGGILPNPGASSGHRGCGESAEVPGGGRCPRQSMEASRRLIADEFGAERGHPFNGVSAVRERTPGLRGGAGHSLGYGARERTSDRLGGAGRSHHDFAETSVRPTLPDGLGMGLDVGARRRTPNEQLDAEWGDLELRRRGGSEELALPSTRGVGRARPEKKPSTYDGKVSWLDYKVQFEMISMMNGWTQRRMAMELAASLRDEAVGVLALIEPERRTDYHTLTTALEARFEPRNQTEIHRAALRTRTRKRGETLSSLSQELKKLTRKVYPTARTEVWEQLTLSAFLDALNDAEMEWSVHQGRPATVEEAVQLAMDFESFKQARARRRSRDAVGLYLLQDAGNENDRSKKTNRRCWVCDEIGHIARFCKQRVPRHPLNGGRVRGNGAAGQKSGNGQ